MMTPLTDGQWLDYYALLNVPVGATEDEIRRRIGKVYSEAAANSDHRDLARRHYSQTLVERVLPQCRRVLLDPEWRAKYDRQHILHSNADPSAQSYVTFIASMRGSDFVPSEDQVLPQLLQEELHAAREVVECAFQGTELNLLPSQAVSTPGQAVEAPAVEVDNVAEAAKAVAPAQAAEIAPVEVPPSVPVEVSAPQPVGLPAPPKERVAPKTKPDHEPIHAQVITAQEAAEIRRRRGSNPDPAPFVGPKSGTASGSAGKSAKKPAMSRFSVGDVGYNVPQGRLLSPMSMNLMVAIVGVMLTMTIQRFTVTPAVATNTGRTPIYLAVASEMEGILLRAESEWEKTPEGSAFDVIVQPVDSHAGLRRALGTGGSVPDAWIPSDGMWAERYNTLAPKYKRANIASSQSVAQTPMVLIANSRHSAELRRRFPNHQIPSWGALREAVATGAKGRFGITDPQKAATGALARVSMAREWGASRGLNPKQAAQNPNFWRWMAAFEENAPAAPAQTAAMVKDLVLGTTGRYWWGLAYESDALGWMKSGKALEIYYLPRTTLADHPFCDIERVGAPLEVAQGRANFEKFLRSTAMQKKFLSSGFRPTEVSLTSKTSDNPFLNTDFRARGTRAGNLPRDERANASATEVIGREWGKRYG